jgi:diguanylate cyclase (GGDEF)-like protein
VATGTPALITVWGRVGGMPAEIHAYGMELARNHVELILRWSHQAAGLDAAAHTDSLTGLPNRRSLFELIDGDQRGGALLFCDLDHFKPVNDRHGHAVGDAVLQVVADRLRRCVRSGDVVARTGGDEFVVLAHEADDVVAADLSDRIVASLTEPISAGGVQVRLGISVGVARTDGPLSDGVLARADRAMLADKARRHDRASA